MLGEEAEKNINMARRRYDNKTAMSTSILFLTAPTKYTLIGRFCLAFLRDDLLQGAMKDYFSASRSCTELPV